MNPMLPLANRTFELRRCLPAALLLGSLLAMASIAAATWADESGGKRAEESDRGTTITNGQDDSYTPLSDVELRRKLSRISYDVTQNDATEPAFRNRYWNNKQKGVYECIVCELDLFTSETKFKSGTGWPSFWAPVSEKAVGYRTDYHLVYPRTEVHCSRCEAHLGHVFNDGPRPTGKRFCMNSASMKFVKKDAKRDSDGKPTSSQK